MGSWRARRSTSCSRGSRAIPSSAAGRPFRAFRGFDTLSASISCSRSSTSRVARALQLGSWLGLVLSRQQSGESYTHGQITKTGSRTPPHPRRAACTTPAHLASPGARRAPRQPTTSSTRLSRAASPARSTDGCAARLATVPSRAPASSPASSGSRHRPITQAHALPLAWGGPPVRRTRVHLSPLPPLPFLTPPPHRLSPPHCYSLPPTLPTPPSPHPHLSLHAVSRRRVDRRLQCASRRSGETSRSWSRIANDPESEQR